jgi:uncharacterized membrane protein
MTISAHLWAVGYDDERRAEQMRNEIAALGERHCLVLRDTAVAVRYTDGSFTLDGEPYVPAGNISGRGLAGLLARLALGAPPLIAAAVGFSLRSTHCTGPGAAVISEEFVGEVQAMMKPGTSALFVLDEVGDLDALLHLIRGLGGTVLKTTVDLQRATLIQATLAATAISGDAKEGRRGGLNI